MKAFRFMKNKTFKLLSLSVMFMLLLLCSTLGYKVNLLHTIEKFQEIKEHKVLDLDCCTFEKYFAHDSFIFSVYLNDNLYKFLSLAFIIISLIFYFAQLSHLKEMNLRSHQKFYRRKAKQIYQHLLMNLFYSTRLQHARTY
jgi:hypothetical protein